MSDRENFEKWAKSGNWDLTRHGDGYDKGSTSCVWQAWQAAVEHCKQGDYVAIYEQDTNHLHELQDGDMAKGWRWMRKDFARGDKLFTHAMPKSEPVAWYYRFKNAKGWGAWNITAGPEKPVNVAFEDMEARPLVFGDLYTPQPYTDVSELVQALGRIKELGHRGEFSSRNKTKHDLNELIDQMFVVANLAIAKHTVK